MNLSIVYCNILFVHLLFAGVKIFWVSCNVLFAKDCDTCCMMLSLVDFVSLKLSELPSCYVHKVRHFPFYIIRDESKALNQINKD